MSEESEQEWEEDVPPEYDDFYKDKMKKGKKSAVAPIKDKIEDPKKLFKREKYPGHRTYDDEEEGTMVNVGGLWEENLITFEDENLRRRKQRKKKR